MMKSGRPAFFLITSLFIAMFSIFAIDVAADENINPQKAQDKSIKIKPASAVQTGSLRLIDSLENLGSPDTKSSREWTVMIYMDADNDLEPFALKDINEMEAGMPESGVEVVVLIDRAKGYDRSEGDWTDARVYRIVKDINPDKIASEVIAKPGELNMGDPGTLASFIKGAVHKFPARHYALIFWDHGGGWIQFAIDHDAPGSPRGYDALTLSKASSALRHALASVNLERLDLIGFDMCLMGQIETAYEFSGLADVMVASEAVEPGDGWPYDEILPVFVKGGQDARRLASQMVGAFGNFYKNRKERIATLSALDLKEIAEAAKTFNKFAGRAADAAPGSWSVISRSIFYAESYADRTDMRRGEGALSSVDIIDLVKRMSYIIPDFPPEYYRDLVAAMDKAVIANSASLRHRLSHGLAIYAPVTGGQYNRIYEEMRFARESSWPALLAEIYKYQKKFLTVPRIADIRLIDSATGKQIKGGKPGGGFRVEAVVEGENVLWVKSLHGVKDKKNKGMVFLAKSYVWDPEFYKKKVEAVADMVDFVMPEFKGRKNIVSEEFLGRYLSVTNGKAAARATIDMSSLSDMEHVAAPVMIKRPGVEKHFATVFFNAITWSAVNIVGEIPQPDGSVAYRQIKPQPDDDITLLFEFLPDNGDKTGYLEGETFKWKDGLELVIDNKESGEVIVAMQAESFGGSSDFKSTAVIVEPFTKEEQVFLDNARKVKAENLIGAWQWHGLKDGKWQPIPTYTEITPSKTDPKVLIARTYNPADPSWKVSPQTVLLDTRLMPTLRLISHDEDGRPVEAMNFTMLVSGWENNSPRMILKYLVPKGWLILWTKKGSSGASTGQSETASSFSPAQPKIAPLAGAWKSPAGFAVVFSDSQFELYQFNQRQDRGAYKLQGNQLYMKSSDTGEISVYLFQVSSNRMLLQDARGQIYQFIRADVKY